MPTNPSEPARLKKGDRVECVYNGKPIYGAISKIVGEKATMMLDGGKQSLTGNIEAFKLSLQPPPADPVASDADHWSVTDFQPFNGRDDCVAFEAKLCRDGQPVLRAYNNGIQSVDEISPLAGASRDDVAEFSKAVRSWLAANGQPRMGNPLHLWISWYVEKRPFGISSGAFLRSIAARAR